MKKQMEENRNYWILLDEKWTTYSRPIVGHYNFKVSYA